MLPATQACLRDFVKDSYKKVFVLSFFLSVCLFAFFVCFA